ncbi:MAG: hypothetical protein AAGE94_03990 [Acidobacteriota bacterium]
MSRTFRFVLCLVLLLAVPTLATADASCAGATAAVDAPFDLASILPTTVIPTTNAFSCPFAFWSASWCSQCWAAYNQCSGPDCYACTEICLGRLNCFIP